ncbi:hypothetical protein LGV59_21105 [Bacteroides fragilis]|nr:hypothetical protein [Bacteroides fragilis]
MADGKAGVKYIRNDSDHDCGAPSLASFSMVRLHSLPNSQMVIGVL